MLKSLGILAGGIFSGAVGAEIVRKACPNGLDGLYAKVRDLAATARDAFAEGYRNAVREPVEGPAEACERICEARTPFA